MATMELIFIDFHFSGNYIAVIESLGATELIFFVIHPLLVFGMLGNLAFILSFQFTQQAT